MTAQITTNNLLLRVVSCLFVLFLFAHTAWAEPIPRYGKFVFIFGFKLLERLFDVTVTMLLLRTYRLNIFRLAGAYLVVTIALFSLLFPVILPAFDGNLVLAGFCMILLETAALFMLTNLEWFRSDGTANLLIRTLLMAVVCGNLVSMLLSVGVVAPLQFGLLRYIIHPH